MPQYISLAQQGFFQPYQQLGESLARYSDRKDRKKERKEDVDWRNTRRNDELSQQDRTNKRADTLDKLNLDTGTFSLTEAKKKAAQQAALENFDINSLSVPEQPVAAGNIGLPVMPAPAIKLDLNLPFSAQPPEIQQNLIKYAHQNFLPLQQLTGAFQQQQSAMTGRTPMPTAPAGMRPTKFEDRGVTFEADKQAPNVRVQETPYGPMFFDVNTGQQLSAPKTADGLKELTQTELSRLEAIEQASRDLDKIEAEFKNFNVTGPVAGALQYLNPYVGDRKVLDQAVTAAVPNLARGVFREVGVLTDEDVKRYAQQYPTVWDSPETRQRKLSSLRARLGESRAGALANLQKAGRDVGGFTPQTLPQNPTIQPPSGASPTFNSVAEAEASNLPPGTPILILNPTTGKYKRAIK